MANEDIRFQMGMDVQADSVDQAKQKLKELSREMEQVTKGIKLDVNEQDIEKTKTQISALERSIKEAERSGGSFGNIFEKNMKEITAETKKAAAQINNLDRESKQFGNNGARGFQSVSKAAKLATSDIRGTQSQMDKLRTNMEQGLGQTIAFGAIGAVSGGLISALNVAKDLDKVSTDIRIVSGQTADEMKEYRDAASDASDILGTTTQKYLEASLIYKQQGGEAAYYAKELAESTVVAANISGVATDQMSEYLTSTINGFELLKEKGGEAGTYVTDVLAQLGAASGSDLGEVATGLTRVAATAKEAGYEFEEISTMIATVSERTRRSPETIGNAFKSILSNFTQLKEAGEDDVNAFTSKVEEAFKTAKLDISLFDNGQLRDAADIFGDIADQWDTMNKEQQALVATNVAGKYQMENFIAFMESQERYQDLLAGAYESAGTAANQQLIYMDSLQAKTDQLKNAWQEAVDKVVDSDMFKGILEDLTNAVKLVGAMDTGFQGAAVAAAPLIGLGGNFFAAPKLKESYINKQMNSSLVDDKDIESSVKALNLEEEAEKRLIAQKKEERDITKETNKIMQQLGPEAAQRYQQMADEAANLHGQLSLVKEDEKERIALGEQILAQIDKGATPKGINVSEIENRASSIKGDNSFGSVQKQEIEALNEQLQKAVSLQREYGSTEGLDKKFSSDMEYNKDLMSQWEYSVESVLTGEKKVSEIQEAKLQKAYRLIEAVQKEGNFSEENLNSNKELKQSLKDINNIHTEIVKNQKEEVNKSAEKVAEAEKELTQLARKKAATEQVDKISDNAVDTRSDVSLLNKGKENIGKLATNGVRLENAVRGAATAYQAIIPLMATYKAAQEGVLSKQDSVITGTQAIGAALMSTMNPWGMAAGAAVTGMGLVIDHFDLLKSRGEKAKEANEELIKSFLSLQEQVSGNQENLSSIEDSYKGFQGIDAAAFLATKPDPSDTEAVKKYNEQLQAYDDIAGKIAATNPELVEGYDNSGRAVVDLSKSYEELVEIQSKASADNFKLLSTNSDSFVTQQAWDLKNQSSDLDKATISYRKSKEKLDAAKKVGNDEQVNKELANITKQQSKIAELKGTFGEVKGSIQTNLINPFHESNEEFQKLEESAPEVSKAFKELSSTYLNTDTVSGLLSGGDEKSVNNLLANLGKIREEFLKLNQTNPAQAVEFLDSIKNSSEYAKASLFETSASLEDLQKKLASDRTALGDTLKDSAKISFFSSEDTEEALRNSDKLKEAAKDLSKAQKDSAKDKKNMGFTSLRAGLNEYDYENKFDDQISQNKALEKYGDMEDQLDKVRDRYEKTTKTVEGFNAALGDMDSLDHVASLIKQIGEDGANSDAFSELEKQAPEYAKKLSKAAKEGGDSLKTESEDSYNAVKATQEAAVQGMMANNEDFFSQWKTDNANLVDNLASDYGIDANNYATMSQFKQNLEGLSLSELTKIAIDKKLLSKETNDDIVAEESAAAKKRIEIGDVLESEQLNSIQKIQVSLLSMWDGLRNVGSEILTDLRNNFAKFLNWFEVKIAKVSLVINKIKKNIPLTSKKQKAEYAAQDKESREIIKNGGNEKDDHKATQHNSSRKLMDDYVKDYQEEQKKKQDVIDLITKGQYSSMETAQRAGAYTPKTAQSITPGNLNGDETKKNDPLSKKDDESNKKEIDNLELELDRYYKLDHLLSQLQTRYDDLSDAKDAAYGQDKLNAMDKEQSLLKERAGLLNRYTNELSQEQAELRNKLNAGGFSFDSNGDIANLNQRLTELQNAANSKAGDAKEEAIANVKKIQEEAKRYTEVTFNLIPDKQKTLKEIQKQLASIAKERIEYQIKLQVDKNDLKEQVIDTVKELNDGFANSDERLQLVGQSMKSALDQVDFFQKKLAQIRADSSLTDADRQALLQDTNKNLLSAVSKAQSAYKDLGSEQANYVKELKEAFSVITERYQNILDKTDTLIDKTSELYGARGYGKIQEYYKVQEEALGEQLGFLQQAQKEMVRYRNSLKQGTDAWKDANDAVNDLGKQIEESLLKKLESVQKQFEAFTENLSANFEKMFGAWGFDGAKDSFDDLLDKQDKYLSSFEKLSTIGQRIKAINEDIAKTNDPQRAAELAALRDKEYAVLLKQDKVTKDDYERAEKLYQLKLKELAIQERENVQRAAQLVRDQNGNMTYEYIRKETSDTQSELDELQKQKDELYAFDSDKVKESAKGVFDVISKYQSQLKELQDKGLSPDEYKKELAKLLNDAESDIKDKTTEMNKWLENAGKDGMSSLQNMIKNGVVDPNSLGLDKNTMDSIFGAMQDGSLSIQDMLSGDYGDFASSIGTTSDELKSQMDSMLELILGDNFDIAQAMMDASNKWTSTAQTNVSALGNAYSQYMSAADKVLQQYSNSTGTLNNLLNQTNAAAGQVIGTTKVQTDTMLKAQQQTDRYSSSVAGLTNKLVGANGLYTGMVQVTRTMNDTLQPAMVSTGNRTVDLANKTNYSAQKYMEMSNKALSAYNRVNAFRDEPTKRAMDRIDQITSKSNRSATAFKNITTDASKARQGVIDFSGAVQNLKSYGAYKLDTGGLVSGATGMYTGTWNNSANNADGRLALLHEKEIVLNKSDTQNLLDAVHMQRDLLKSVEGRGIDNERMVGGMSNNISNIQTTNSSQSVLQPVTIHADFPGVNKSSEIEAAFQGLFGQASTYIGKASTIK